MLLPIDDHEQFINKDHGGHVFSLAELDKLTKEY